MPTLSATETMTEDSLCDVCKNIPFSEIFEGWISDLNSSQNSSPSPMAPGPFAHYPIRTWTIPEATSRREWRINKDFLQNQGCSFCRLLASCCPKGIVGTVEFTPSDHSNGPGNQDDRNPEIPELFLKFNKDYTSYGKVFRYRQDVPRLDILRRKPR